MSYLKEKSCMAGVMGAKEGEACGAEDNDTCGVSLYKASPTCGIRSLGPRSLRAGASGSLGDSPIGSDTLAWGWGWGPRHLYRIHHRLL